MAIKLTHSQELARDKTGNILVAAAAGSGKTAVLVERVIKKLCSKTEPVNADRLLIVTFTNAAAAEMRGRIEKRLDEECRKNPDDTGLLLQKHLLSSAKICTIDSFCIDFVRDNFEKLGIAPDFSISDQNNLNTVNDRVLAEIINEYLTSNNETFKKLLDIVGSEFDEGEFFKLVLDLYNYSRQLPFPERWLELLYKPYGEGFGRDNSWRKYAFEIMRKSLNEMLINVANAVDLLSVNEKMADKFLPLFIFLSEQLHKLEVCCDAEDWDRAFDTLSNMIFPSVPRVSGSNDIPEIKAAKDIYDNIKEDGFKPLYKIFYAQSSFIDAQFKKLYEPMRLLAQILTEFSNRVFEEYKRENTFTFHNTEALALKLLCNETENGIAISQEGREFLDLYDEVCVDEYQDTNDLQNMLFYVLSNKDSRLFAVGDVKQSIYGFRGANPDYFLNKKNSYVSAEKATSNEAQKIILGNNFRSRAEVCHFINYFFSLMMTDKTGKINYDNEEMLIPSGEFPKCSFPPVSIDIIENDTCEKNRVIEARQIASFIKETMLSGKIIRQDKDTLREAKYSDFTILLRSMKNKAGVIAEELRKQGIPVNFSTEGFCEFTEIAVMLSLLRVIDNPSNDVELLSVVMSPIFGFTADDMARLRINSPEGSIYSCIMTASRNGDKRAENFLKSIEKFRLYAVTNTLPQLLGILLEETGFLNTVSAFSDGVRRKNNLLLLMEYAKSYCDYHKPSISGFVNFIIKQNESGMRSATAISGGNAVKIMSIHASKGLQFPVCIIAGTADSFNNPDSKSSCAYSTKSGIGFKYYDEADKSQYTTISREAIIQQKNEQDIEEELRLLYVAMTRTEDILHFTAAVSDLEKQLSEAKSIILGNNSIVSGGMFKKMNSYWKWLLTSLILHPDSKALRGNGTSIICKETESHIKLRQVTGSEIANEISSQNNTVFPFDTEYSESLNNNLAYKYPFEALFSVASKASVSILANKAQSEKYNFTAKPAFMSEGGINAAGRGTAMHKLMQFFDFSKWQSPENEIERLREWQFISDIEADAVNISALNKFFESDIFKRLQNAKSVNREMRFLTELSAKLVDSNLDESFKDEEIIIQGAVDVCFEEADGIVILDFKTDRTDNLEDLKETYGQQLRIYALACEKIFKKPIKQMLIYSFHNSAAVEI